MNFKGKEVQSFVEYCLSEGVRGEDLLDLVEDFVEHWSDGGGFHMELEEALGMSKAEFDLFRGDDRRIISIIEEKNSPKT